MNWDSFDVDVDDVRRYWDARPCNIRHSAAPVGTREYFDQVEARKYRVEPHIPTFAEFDRWKGKRVLELGCGIGTDTMNFARAGASVVAVDLSTKSLDLAYKRAVVYGLDDRIVFIQANIEELPDLGDFDLVYSFGVLHHTPNPAVAFERAWEAVKPGGTMKVMVYNRLSTKAFALSGGRVWDHRLIARQSEAQFGCPVTYTFTSESLRQMLESLGAREIEIRSEHIFPYEVEKYVRYEYSKTWQYRWMPPRAFRWLETRFGWHLLAEMRKA